MTMVACGQMQWPRPMMVSSGVAGGTAAVNMTLDNTADALAWVGRSPVTDTLTKIYFRTGSVTTGADLDVRIETVADGLPTGTLWAANTNVAVTVADSDDNVWKTATLTSAASLTIGDEFAIVIASSSGTPNMALLATAAVYLSTPTGTYPTLFLNNAGGGYVLQSPSFEWVVEFSGGIRCMEKLAPINGALTTTTFNSGSTPNERGMRFQVPFKCRAVGMRAFLYNLAANSEFTFSLWDATGDTDAEALAQAVYDGDANRSATVDGYVTLYFDAAVTLSPNTTYYLGVRADTANNGTLCEASAAGTGAAANAMLAFGAESAEVYLATRTWTAGTAGAWSTTTTTMPIIELLIDQLDDGASAGGGNANILGGSVIQ